MTNTVEHRIIIKRPFVGRPFSAKAAVGFFMILEVKKLINSREGTAEGRFEPALTERDFPTGFLLRAPAMAEYHLARQGEKAALQLKILCPALIQCDRCLKQVERDYRFATDYLIGEADWTGEPELPIDGYGRLDLDELCYQEILLNLPSSLLCSDDCQGLCPVCGKPVEAGCSCSTAIVMSSSSPFP